MKRWSWMLVVLVLSACGDDSSPQGDEGGSNTTEAPSREEQLAECNEGIEGLRCDPSLSLLLRSEDDVADLVVLPLDAVERTDFAHGYLLEPNVPNALVGEVAVHNEVCLVGCMLIQTEGSAACVGTNAEGEETCRLDAEVDAEGCEAFTEACAG